MKITSPQLGISPNSVLGGEVYDREVIKRLAIKGHKINVLLPKKKSFHRQKNLKVNFAPLKHIFPPHLYNLFIVPYVHKQAKNKSTELIRIHVPEFFGPSVWVLKKLFPSLPIIGHYHLDEKGLLFNLINKIFLKYYDLIIADSHYLAEQIKKKFSIPSQKIVVVHCGTDTKTIKPGKKDPALEKKLQLTGNITLLYLGLFIKRKNPQFLIKVFARLHAKHPQTKLIMIGKGPEETNLKQLAKELKVSKSVFFPGPKYGSKKIKYYQTADIFVFPSQNEGFVLSVLEAMAAGLPLVVPKAVSFPEAVTHGSNGLVLKPNSQTIWVKALLKLVSSKKLRNQMSKNLSRAISQAFKNQKQITKKISKNFPKLMQKFNKIPINQYLALYKKLV